MSELRDPTPPSHGEPENVGAIPGDYCPRCGFPTAGDDECERCCKKMDDE
jgi:hypothetical protein